MDYAFVVFCSFFTRWFSVRGNRKFSDGKGRDWFEFPEASSFFFFRLITLFLLLWYSVLVALWGGQRSSCSHVCENTREGMSTVHAFGSTWLRWLLCRKFTWTIVIIWQVEFSGFSALESQMKWERRYWRVKLLVVLPYPHGDKKWWNLEIILVVGCLLEQDRS